MQVNLSFQKSLRHYAIKATKLPLSSRGNQASCAAFCWWLICAFPQWKGEGGKENNIMLFFWQTFPPADIKLRTPGKYYYLSFIDHNNKSCSRVKMRVSQLLVFWLSHLPMMSISSDMNLPSRNAGRLIHWIMYLQWAMRKSCAMFLCEFPSINSHVLSSDKQQKILLWDSAIHIKKLHQL